VEGLCRPNGRGVRCPSVALSRRWISAACLSLGSRYRSISAGSRAADAVSVMLRADIRGSTDAILCIKFCGNYRLPHAIIIVLCRCTQIPHPSQYFVHYRNCISHRGKFMVFGYTQLQYGKQPPSKNENVISEAAFLWRHFCSFVYWKKLSSFLRSTLRLRHSFYYHSSDVAASSGAVMESSISPAD